MTRRTQVSYDYTVDYCKTATCCLKFNGKSAGKQLQRCWTARSRLTWSAESALLDMYGPKTCRSPRDSASLLNIHVWTRAAARHDPSSSKIRERRCGNGWRRREKTNGSLRKSYRVSHTQREIITPRCSYISPPPRHKRYCRQCSIHNGCPGINGGGSVGFDKETTMARGSIHIRIVLIQKTRRLNRNGHWEISQLSSKTCPLRGYVLDLANCPVIHFNSRIRKSKSISIVM